MRKNRFIYVLPIIIPMFLTCCTTIPAKEKEGKQPENAIGESQQKPDNISVNHSNSIRDYCSKMQLKLEQNKLLLARIGTKNSAPFQKSKQEDSDRLSALTKENNALELRLRRFRDTCQRHPKPSFRESFDRDMAQLQAAIHAAE